MIISFWMFQRVSHQAFFGCERLKGVKDGYNDFNLSDWKIEVQMSRLSVQFGLYWVFSANQTFTWRYAVNSRVCGSEFGMYGLDKIIYNHIYVITFQEIQYLEAG